MPITVLRSHLPQGLLKELLYLRFHFGPRSQGRFVGYVDLHGPAFYLVPAFHSLPREASRVRSQRIVRARCARAHAPPRNDSSKFARFVKSVFPLVLILLDLVQGAMPAEEVVSGLSAVSAVSATSRELQAPTKPMRRKLSTASASHALGLRLFSTPACRFSDQSARASRRCHS